MKTIFFILSILGLHPSYCQISETFSDGNFSVNPAWQADTNKWKVSSDLRLQSKSQLAGDLFYISTSQPLSGSMEWRFNATLQFNTSSANYVDVFLTATHSNLNSSNNRGYFLRIGSTEDDICLYRKDSFGIVKMLDGPDGFLNTSTNHLSIVVSRDQRNEWSFGCRKETTNTVTYVSGYIVDSIYNQSSCFGISVRQSTSSFFGKHFFDDIIIRTLSRDSLAPRLNTVKVRNGHEIELTFDERIDGASFNNSNNYFLTERSEFPYRAIQDSSDPRIVCLYFLNNLPERKVLNLRIQHLIDRYGNSMNDTLVKLAYYVPHIHDILMTELMADPEPSVGIPVAEWLELHNPSVFTINLKGWRIGKPYSDPVYLPDINIPSGGYAVLTSASGSEKLSSFCPSFSVSGFPTLSNDGDTLLLFSDSGKLIHQVIYSASWHENSVKTDGGWSLEMKDITQPCIEKENWTSSSGYYGGTPGVRNASSVINKDLGPPFVINAFCTDSLRVHLLFNESLDSMYSVDKDRYLIDHGIGNPVFVEASSPFFKELILTTSKIITNDTIYHIELTGPADCAGNVITKTQASFARFSDCQAGDLLINEILFNPVSGGYDYVEIYNNSKRAVDLSKIRIANKDAVGAAANSVPLVGHPFALLPGQFFVVTSDKEGLSKLFLVKNVNSIMENNKLPSFPDDEGSVLLLDQRGLILDEFDYSDKLHFELINDTEGISLERVTASGPTNSASNWHSAAGRGTPGYENSQSYHSTFFQRVIQIDSPVFSPDLDGWQDIAIIRYQFPSEGFLLSVTVYSLSGMPVRILANNLLAGTSGLIQWNGLDDRGKMLRPGTYIICSEYFNRKGEKGKIKKTVVLASAY